MLSNLVLGVENIIGVLCILDHIEHRMGLHQYHHEHDHYKPTQSYAITYPMIVVSCQHTSLTCPQELCSFVQFVHPSQDDMQCLT